MNVKITFDDKYEWDGNLGAWFRSKERNLSIGTVRCIRGVLFNVAYQHGTYFEPRTCWTPCKPNLHDIEFIRQFRNKLIKGQADIIFDGVD